MKIKAIPFMRAARDWAISNNKPFFTWWDQEQSILDYLAFLKSNR